MGIYIFGNAAAENLTVSGDISGNLIAFGSGSNDFVLTSSATGSVTVSNNIIVFGDVSGGSGD
jgi:hypothetical protein